jgi:glutaredoxin
LSLRPKPVRLRVMRAPALVSALAASLLLAAPAAHALFKVVGPDGRVTYTDRPPSASEGRVVNVDRETGRSSDPALPFALRQVATRFPVTLYTASTCGDACALGRNLLSKRGVPFTERVAESDEEREAWPRLVGGSEAPVLKVGGQTLRGFTPGAWDETLDTAGYPRQSQLPASYQTPAPIPLIERKPPPPKAAPTPVLPAPENGSNPSGIRF